MPALVYHTSIDSSASCQRHWPSSHGTPWSFLTTHSLFPKWWLGGLFIFGWSYYSAFIHVLSRPRIFVQCEKYFARRHKVCGRAMCISRLRLSAYSTWELFCFPTEPTYMERWILSSMMWPVVKCTHWTKTPTRPNAFTTSRMLSWPPPTKRCKRKRRLVGAENRWVSTSSANPSSPFLWASRHLDKGWGVGKAYSID